MMSENKPNCTFEKDLVCMMKRKSFPLDGADGLRCQVVQDAVDAVHLCGNAVCDFVQERRNVVHVPMREDVICQYIIMPPPVQVLRLEDKEDHKTDH